jgi:hypothetical protein
MAALITKWFNGLATGDKIATIATLVGFLQFVALVATFALMRRSARQQLRAYISGLPDWITSFDETHPPRASYTMRNLGQTPAYKVVHRSEIAALPFPLPVGFRLPPVNGTIAPATVLFPNVPLIGNSTKAAPFTADELAGIRNRSMRPYIFGEIRYRDVFRKRRRSTFCVSVYIANDNILEKITSNSTDKFSDVQYYAAPIGNDAT